MEVVRYLCGMAVAALVLGGACGGSDSSVSDGGDAMVCSPPPTACDDQNPCTTDHLDIGPGCQIQCSHTAIPDCCGNGIVESGEFCDDGNVKPLDGCSPQCRFERALAMDAISFPAPGSGCDLGADGQPDEALNRAMNDMARAWLNGWLSNDLHKQPNVVLLTLVDLTDPTAQSGSARFAFLQGVDLSAMPMYFSGSEPFYVTAMDLEPGGVPSFMMPISLSAGQLSGPGPGTLVMPYPLVTTYPFRVDRTQLTAQITAGTDRPSEISVTRLCGSFAAPSMHRVRSPDTAGPPTLLDAVALGDQLFSFVVTPTQPDQDIDGDGLEMFFDDNNDKKIDRCVDGNGTVIQGEDCPFDPRISDGYSMTLTMHGVGVYLSGQQP